MKMTTVLVVDDDANLLKMLSRILMHDGLQVVSATNGQEALAKVSAYCPEIIVLDWIMPGLDGLEVIRRLRDDNNRVFILMLTARDSLDQRIEGLESGADNYLVKPFEPRELIARIHALLRRTESWPTRPVETYGKLLIDPNTRSVTFQQKLLNLTPTEFELLYLFMQHPGIVLERALILANVWGYDFRGDDNVLEVYVGYLRKKMELAGGAHLIHTVRGIGYMLRED